MSVTPTNAINDVHEALRSVKLALKNAGENGTVGFLHHCELAKENLELAWEQSYKGHTAKKARLMAKYSACCSEEYIDTIIFCGITDDEIDDKILKYYMG